MPVSESWILERDWQMAIEQIIRIPGGNEFTSVIHGILMI